MTPAHTIHPVIKTPLPTIPSTCGATPPSTPIQLFGTFDQDTKNAIIITAREVPGE